MDIKRGGIFQMRDPEEFLSFAFDIGRTQVQEKGLCLITFLQFSVTHRELLENISWSCKMDRPLSLALRSHIGYHFFFPLASGMFEGFYYSKMKLS